MVDYQCISDALSGTLNVCERVRYSVAGLDMAGYQVQQSSLRITGQDPFETNNSYLGIVERLLCLTSAWS